MTFQRQYDVFWVLCTRLFRDTNPISLVFWVLAQDFSENMLFGLSFRSGELFRGINMFFWVFAQYFSETPLALPMFDPRGLWAQPIGLVSSDFAFVLGGFPP